ncbi:MAG: EAL domain-containing protein [Acidobacteriaceae bacterium]|nr:EAL domain-containing protein [Acidobacteriaceae bacterium]
MPRELLRVASRLAGIAIEQRQLTDRLAFQAQHDYLTGLPNRFRLLEILEQRLTSAQARSGMLAVLVLDLDRFKQINDSLGHPVGDRLLIEAGERIRAVLKADDAAGRMGGDEFSVVLASARTEQQAMETSRTLLDTLSAPYLVDGRELIVTASIGMSLFPNHGQDASTLLHKADSAMYRAKNEGKNAIECYRPDTQHGTIEQLDLENALRRALEKGEFELLFQPIVSLQGELEAFEALLAWNHPKLGRVPPGQFIPLAEETGLITSIGAWVLRAACEQAVSWLNAGLPVKRIAVNVSAMQFARPDFVETVASALSSTGLPPGLLELELTESLVLRDISDSIHRMAQLRELGVVMAIDDFGTGYSSLNYLRRLPVHELKIDQSFVRDLRATPGTLHVVQTIATLAHNMNLSVVAEGVETADQLELVRVAGCDRVQGHLYGMSLSAEKAEVLLRRTDVLVPIAAD